MTVGVGGWFAQAATMTFFLQLGLVLDWPSLHPVGGAGSVLFLGELRLLRNCLPYGERSGCWQRCGNFGLWNRSHLQRGGPLPLAGGHLLGDLGSCTSSHQTRGSDRVSRVLEREGWEQRMWVALQGERARA